MLKVLGWIFIPYIMLIFNWKKLDQAKRSIAIAWSILLIIGAIVNGSGSADDASKANTASPSKVEVSSEVGGSDQPSIEHESNLMEDEVTQDTDESKNTENEPIVEDSTAQQTPAVNAPSSEGTSNAAGAAPSSNDSNYDAILYFPASEYPETAAHISTAIQKGESAVCTIDRDGADDNRNDSLAGIPTRDGYDRDEWPMAMCEEGGAGADIAYVTPSDNRGAGSWVGNQLEDYSDGTRILFVIDGTSSAKVIEAKKGTYATAPSTSTPKTPVSSTPKTPVSNPTPVPAPAPAPTPAPEPETHEVYYKNCSQVRDAGAAPIYAGDPGYSRKLDRDGDGVACE